MRYAEQKFGCVIIADENDNLDHCDRAKIISLLNKHGWLLFRNFCPTLDKFVEFTSNFGTCTPVRKAPTSSTAINYHAEDSYNPFRPDAIFFHCIEVGSDEGASTFVCDGEVLFQMLPPSLKTKMRGQRLRFDRLYSKQEWQGVTKIVDKEDVVKSLTNVPGLTVEFTSDDSMYIGFEAPVISEIEPGRLVFANSMLHGSNEPEFYGMSFSNGSPVPEEITIEIDDIARSIETGIRWKNGDIALIDNRRLLHRRGEYFGKGRDLRVTNCENLFCSPQAEIYSTNAVQIKQLIQGEAGNPEKTGWEMARSILADK